MPRIPADPEQAIRALHPVMRELMRVAQLLRKDQIGNEGREYINESWANAYDGRYPTDDEVEGLLGQVYPWLWGERSIMPLLLKINDDYDAGRLPNGQQVYNVLFIVHRLDNSSIIKKGYEVFTNDHGRELPMPETWMCLVGI